MNFYLDQDKKPPSIIKKESPSIIQNDQDKKPPSKIQNDIRKFEYDGKNIFDGIVKYLTKITGGNIHDNETIKVTSNSILSDIYHPKTLLNSVKIDKRFSPYQSNGTSFAWICFDFKDYLIKLTYYSIQSAYWSKNIGHIKSWVIEISNDDKNWEEIDKHDNCHDLNGPNLIKTYKVRPNEFSRYVRFRHTCETWDGGTYGFNAIEFYGSLKMP